MPKTDVPFELTRAALQKALRSFATDAGNPAAGAQAATQGGRQRHLQLAVWPMPPTEPSPETVICDQTEHNVSFFQACVKLASQRQASMHEQAAPC
ncbi:hypothetical protein PO002_36880 [Cupriavidus necator]|uniref:hypothetical protein n=1 Tax=Cupriavidus necator TaxID=106590 RepID=UPI0039C3D150